MMLESDFAGCHGISHRVVESLLVPLYSIDSGGFNVGIRRGTVQI